VKIIWSPISIDRITEIAKYIAIDNRRAANTWIEEVFKKVEQLQSFPRSGRIVPELNEDIIREIIYGNYRIIYRIELKQISILTIRNIRQILPEIEVK
jgi:plasmid stabilization system protein ParE